MNYVYIQPIIVIIHKLTCSTTKVALYAFYLSVLQNNVILQEENNISETESSLKSHLDVTVWLEKGLNGQVELHLRQNCCYQNLKSLK